MGDAQTSEIATPEKIDIWITDTVVSEPNGNVVKKNGVVTWHNQRTVNVWVIFWNKEEPVGPTEDDSVQNSFELAAQSEATKKAKKNGTFDYVVSTSPPAETEFPATRGPPTIRIL